VLSRKGQIAPVYGTFLFQGARFVVGDHVQTLLQQHSGVSRESELPAHLGLVVGVARKSTQGDEQDPERQCKAFEQEKNHVVHGQCKTDIGN
jgi:hypothetical protein